jgi:hypothetical protein
VLVGGIMDLVGRPAEFNLEWYDGDTNHWQFKLWTDAAKTVPFSLVGKTVRAQARERPEGSQVVDLRVVVTGPNIVDVYLDFDDHVPFEKGAWDLRVTDTSATPDIRTTVLAGSVLSGRAVTDSTP